jgi:hypothetical protein
VPDPLPADTETDDGSTYVMPGDTTVIPPPADSDTITSPGGDCCCGPTTVPGCQICTQAVPWTACFTFHNLVIGGVSYGDVQVTFTKSVADGTNDGAVSATVLIGGGPAAYLLNAQWVCHGTAGDPNFGRTVLTTWLGFDGPAFACGHVLNTGFDCGATDTGPVSITWPAVSVVAGCEHGSGGGADYSFDSATLVGGGPC